MAELYRKCSRRHITKGRYVAAVILAIAKIVCSEIGLVRNVDSIALDYNGKQEEIDSAERAIKEMLE